VNSHDLTPEQAARLYESLFPHDNCLLLFKKRLEELRFPEDDPLRLAAAAAYEAAWRLNREAHSQSVRMGCRGKPP
jgi:hypothetical protein